MADVYNYVAETGVITTDTGEILTEVQSEYQAAFGADLNVAPNTPQGILISTEVAARTAVADNNAALANQINPNEAGGVFLDALLALTGAFRSPGTPSTALCNITGVAGTSIPAGAQISDASGDAFEIVTTTVIPTVGYINDVSFQSVLNGPVPGLSGTLTTIVSNILGWETVTNPANATLGTTTQSDISAKLLRQNTLAAQGMGLAASITAAVYLLAPNTSLTFQENIAGTTETINGIPMISHSLYTCVSSTATLQSIAQAISNSKNGGCGYNNGLGIPQSIPITNPISGQTINVLFDTPSMVNISIIATVHAFTSIQNVTTAVQNAIIQYINGGIPNEAGWVVGASVSPFQLAGAINILVPGLFVQEIQIAVESFTQQGTITSTMNTVTGLTYNAPFDGFQGIAVGMDIAGANITSGTTVASLVGSTGITMSTSVGVTATEILTFSPASLSYQTTEIPIGVWQQAVTSIPYITVVPV